MKHVIEYFAANKVKLFELMLKKWKTLQELVRVLRIPYEATIKLQDPFITLSDAYSFWTKMTLHLEACAAKDAFKTKLPQKLIAALNERKSLIFNTVEMECCLFLDPRFRRVVLNNGEPSAQVKEYLVDLWSRINCSSQNNTSKNAYSDGSTEFHFSFDETSEFSSFL